ncbi:MAG: thioesterase domain-containing protein [Planctomycetota bacterium]
MSDSNPFAARVRRLNAEQKRWLANQLTATLGDKTTPSAASELVAWIATSETLEEATIREELSSRLTPALIPKRFVQMESLPKTGSGKIDRKQLKLDVRPSRGTSPVDRGDCTPSERKLIHLCETLLQVERVSPKDNFAAMGGDSMRSIQLIALAREQGLMLEPRDIHECESLVELARVADQRSQPSKKHLAAETSVVTEVRSGQTTGSILLIHEVGGECHYAHHLAPILGTDRTLYVTRQPHKSDSPKSIEGLATRYLDAWLKVDRNGPHVIVAFCWGGLLGYELARQMKARGISPKRLVIIESGTEAAYAHAWRFGRCIDRARGLSIRIRNRLRSLTSARSVVGLVGSLGRKLIRRPAPITADSGFQFRDDEGDPEQIRNNVQAFLDYAIEPDTLDLHLFRVDKAAGLIGTRYSSPSFGWRYLVGNRLSITSVPGDHDTCMKPPNVEHLASAINRLLDHQD